MNSAFRVTSVLSSIPSIGLLFVWGQDQFSIFVAVARPVSLRVFGTLCVAVTVQTSGRGDCLLSAPPAPRAVSL